MTWVRKRAALLAFVLLAVFSGVAINISAQNTARADALVVWRAQIKSCYRGNTLRREINRRVSAFDAERNVVIDFLEGAATARSASFKATHQKSDHVAAVKYAKDAGKLRKVHYGFSPIVNCAVAIPKP